MSKLSDVRQFCHSCGVEVAWASTLENVGEFAVARCCGHTYYFSDADFWKPQPVRKPKRKSRLFGALLFVMVLPISLCLCFFTKE